MSRKKHFQFFTTDNEGWFPIDHFFYAQCREKNGKMVEKGVVVHLEGHATANNGFAVTVFQNDHNANNQMAEEFDDYPTALRRMADIIEAHTRKEKNK